MILKLTFFSLFFLFVMMANASAEMLQSEICNSNKLAVDSFTEFQTDGRTNTEATATIVEIVPQSDDVVVGQSDAKMKVLDRYEILKDEYFNRHPIILLKNSRAKTEVKS